MYRTRLAIANGGFVEVTEDIDKMYDSWRKSLGKNALWEIIKNDDKTDYIVVNPNQVCYLEKINESEDAT